MKILFQKIMIVFFSLQMAYCYSTQITDGNRGMAGLGGGGWYSSYFFGIFDSRTGTIAGCSNGASIVRMEKSFLNSFVEYLLLIISSGLISPLIVTWQTNEIYCAANNTPPNTSNNTGTNAVPTNNPSNDKKDVYINKVILKNESVYDKVQAIDTGTEVILKTKSGKVLKFNKSEVDKIE